jgi:pimeloyl-ACP methyl ester carboxylesterase
MPQSATSRLDGPEPVHVPGPDGHFVALHDFGGEGPPLLFAHATGMHGWTWSVVAQHLTDQFHCWALDFRGHGESAAKATDDLHFEGFGRDALVIADAIGERNIIGVGHSLGGAALVLAELARPGSFAELFLYEPGLRPNSLPSESQLAYQKVMVDATKRRRSWFASREAALAGYASKPPMSSFQAGALAAYVDYGFTPCAGDEGGVELKCRPEVEARIVAMSFTHDAVARLSSLSCPLTQVFGTLTPPVQQEAIGTVARLTDTRTIAVDGLGHFGPMEQPGTIARVIGRNVLSEEPGPDRDHQVG